MMEDTMLFTLVRQEENSSEEIELRFNHGDMDIHDVMKKIGHFLLSVGYAPESIQSGMNEFDIEAI